MGPINCSAGWFIFHAQFRINAGVVKCSI
ncbi:MJ0042-type zinc finger domain-containing protein [Parasphingorhabdus sp.]